MFGHTFQHQVIPRFMVFLIVFGVLGGGCVSASLPSTFIQSDDALVATAWFDLYLYLIQQTDGFAPPVAARALGYAGVTLYEAVVPGLPEQRSLVGQLNGLTALPQPDEQLAYDPKSAANSAMAALARELFVNTSRDNEELIDSLEQQLEAKLQTNADRAMVARSVDYGRTLAEAIYAWSMTDGGHKGQLKNFPAEYQPTEGSGFWQSTPPQYQRTPLLPYWGNNRPFVLKSGNECAPPPPPVYSEEKTSGFYQQALEVYDAVNHLTPEQRTIALFWADDPVRTLTPPGHLMALTTQLLKESNGSLAFAAQSYATVGIALSDAFIGCWYTKYDYQLVRPITYIQQFIDPTWNNPYITDPVNTPNFPEYTSGHSVQSAAAVTVLENLFGNSRAVTDHTQDHRGFLPRSFPSFWALAQEAAMSRLYGGIHYRSAIENGLTQGRCIGEQILQLHFKN